MWQADTLYGPHVTDEGAKVQTRLIAFIDDASRVCCHGQFLSRSLDLTSLEALNRQFIAWVEENYNAQTHSVLGMPPLDRFALDRSRVRFLPPNEANDELFYVEEERHVRTDNTFCSPPRPP